MADSYIIIKSSENKRGRVSMHATTNIGIPFIITAIYIGSKPKDVKCLSLEHAQRVYELCCGWLYKIPLRNGMVLEMGQA